MEDTAYRAVAIVGAGAILPDAPNVAAFWQNVKSGRYSISEVTPERWDPALYYDADHTVEDKTYSKIGGWVREYEWNPKKWRMAVPPRVVDAMDEAQKWAIACTAQALEDYGYPERSLNTDRTAVILGNAMAGEKHYLTSLRVYFPEYARELAASASFAGLPEAVQADITRELHKRIEGLIPGITEDTMPGELANCIAGRIANIFNFHGPNFVTDAACASAMAAISAAVEGLVQNHYDVAVTGGIDRNMGAPTFVKFCKIGALSATGSRPYAQGADGFVMGEGAAIFILKRLADAERDGDRIYAVLRGIGASSDGKGKGITAPNPAGQRLCMRRAWENAGLSPATVSLLEGHGTSTRVGDVVEIDSMADVLREFNLPVGSVPVGSVKSNIGHLKGAAGAAGLLKTALALRDKVLPPSANCENPSPDIDFAHWPLYVNRELKPWTAAGPDGVRRAGVSAFGFGGTNFHAVMEEYIPHRLSANGKREKTQTIAPPPENGAKAPLRGALVVGASNPAALAEALRAVQGPVSGPPKPADLDAPERVAIDYADAAELKEKIAKALKALAAEQPAVWKALRAQGIFRGHGPAPKVAFLYTGQGSQYVNMLKPLRAAEPLIAETFAEADRIMQPILGNPLSSYIFVDGTDAAAMAQAEEELRQTAITQPAVLATDLGLTRLLAAYGIRPDMTMGHSLGEYGALVASGGLPFADALEAVAARGREMTRVSMADNGRMAAVFAPLTEIERILKTIDGYVVIANINSAKQAVIGGNTKAVEQAMEALRKAGYEVVALPVSHAFHTSIVAPASEPLRQVLERLRLESPRIPIVTNVTGEFYPTGPDAPPRMIDILARQIASPVQFVKGLQKLYDAGARVFVEVGPKKALQGFAEEVLGDRGDVVSLFTNHPKFGDIPSFNQALCGLYAAGLGARAAAPEVETAGPEKPVRQAPVAITGAAVGLPGPGHIFDDSNVARILRGEQFIDVIPTRFRRAMLDKNITRLVKSASGEATFESLHEMAEVIKLAGRGGAFDLEQEFGVSADRVLALDRVTQLAMAAGLDALRDAGIPLVQRYKTTSRGTKLPERWGLPDAMRDDTGVIFACVFPGFDAFAEYITGYHVDRSRREQIALLEDLRARSGPSAEIDRRLADLRAALQDEPHEVDRRFLFRVLSMGHSQFAEFIGARGPNTQVNAACASTTHAVSLAEDWIRAGRCRRVIVVSSDDITTDNLVEWFGAGFLASGAAATDDVVEEAATPFDRRRHGMIMGMGAAAMVIESAEAARERGIRPICEVLSAVTANSAFHGTRLDVEHIGGVMEKLVARAEQASGVTRDRMAGELAFVSHETYTPARGGSASAEIFALRKVFGQAADRIVIANTKGFTGHAMGTGIEDVVAVKALETGCVPPVANFKEVDPELGQLNLSLGGTYPVEFALRLGAGFGSQISMTLLRRVAAPGASRPSPRQLGYATRIADSTVWSTWLNRIAGSSELEVVQRTLRVRNHGAASKPAAPVVEAHAAPGPAPAPVVGENSQPPVPKPQPAVPKPVVQPVAPKAPGDPVKERILALVAEKTGYPSDMLDVDLDLEADLGVDTVKQADLFATIRETYGIVRDDKVKLRDFPTLAHVIGFVHDRRPDLAVAAAPPPTAPAPPAPIQKTSQPVADPVKERVMSLIAEKTGYPLDMLDPDLDLEADLGVDTVKQADLFATIRSTYGIERDDKIKLRDFPTLAHVIRFVHDRRPDLAVAAPPPSAPSQPPPVQKASQPVADPVKERVMALIAEKTGYPLDMLDPDLDLEADLGVDTVKQADLFATIRSTYGIERDDKIKLRDFPTLAHVIRFVHDRRPDLAPAAVPPPPAASQPAPVEKAPQPAADPVKERVMALIAEKTGYPLDMLDPDLDLEADLGVDTVKQADLFATIRSTYGIERDDKIKLRDLPTLAHVIRFVHDRRPDLAPAAVPPPTQPPPVAAAPVAVPAASPVSADPVRDRLLALIAEKTGYPLDMLDPDLDMEADLGVDTVKQADLFASVRQIYNIPRDENRKLRDFPTLAHVIAFVHEMRPDLAETAAPEAAPAPAGTAPVEPKAGIPRRVPVPVLRPPLAMCGATAVAFSPGRRIGIMPDQGGVAALLAARLQAAGTEVVMLGGGADPGAIHGVYWLPALDCEEDLSRMTLTAWREALRLRVKSLYTTMRGLYEQIATPDTFLISATRLGGQHGYGETGAPAPMGGAVCGFTKTYKRERPDALVKAVDFEVTSEAAAIAEALMAEALRDRAAVEIGYQAGLRWTVGLEEQPPEDGAQGWKLGKDTAFLITGAAGGIVSAITADLAACSGGTFYLLDLVPEPPANDPDLARLATDKEGLMRDLHSRIKERGQRATPALVEKELAALERAQAARAAIDAVRNAGGTPCYYSVDLRDADAVGRVIDEVRRRSGRIDVLLHAAGMERSRFLPQKEPREFDLVFDVKADGWFNLLHAIADMPLGCTVAFSSIAGRFGNAGQADYSAANDLLCKIASSFRTTRPETRAIAIDWTAWGGIGMATRGSIPEMMARAGIEMLPPETGVPWIRRELTAGNRRGEVVVAGGLGIMLQQQDGGPGIEVASTGPGLMVGRIAGIQADGGLRIETALAPAEQPFLHDHQIEGKPVLPGVMGIEAFAEAALAVVPGWRVEAVEDVDFLAPFKFYRGDPRSLTIQAVHRPRAGDLVADCRLLGYRALPNQADPQVTTHFTARVRLSRRPVADAPPPARPGRLDGPAIESQDIYRVFFHGPAYQVLERAWIEDGRTVGQFRKELPNDHHPADRPLLMAPRLIELCFQTAALGEAAGQGRIGLPLHVGEVSLLRAPEFAGGPLYAVAQPNGRDGFDVDVVDDEGNRYLRLLGYRMIAHPDAVDVTPLQALHAAMV